MAVGTSFGSPSLKGSEPFFLSLRMSGTTKGTKLSGGSSVSARTSSNQLWRKSFTSNW